MKYFNSLSIFILLSSLILFVGCGKDVIEESGDSTQITSTPYDDALVSFEGLVVDKNGAPIQGALIRSGLATILTDDFGYFKLENVDAKQSSAYVEVEKDGFLKTFKHVSAKEGATGYTKIRMVPFALTETIASSTGGVVNFNGGATVSFPENAFINSAGQNYTGDVEVYAYWMDPTSDRLTEEMPGDLRGINDTEQYLQLSTYGMVSVELRSAAGEELNLAEGKSATVVFPLPDEINGVAPESIPLWSFNEGSGFWEQEGEAQKDGNQYVASVSHFSFWNCDAPFPVVEFEICVRNEDGAPIPNFQIRICAEGVSNAGYGWTDDRGCASGKIPEGKLLTIKYTDQCGNDVELEEIGPFYEATNIGVTILNNDQYLYTLEGQLVGCMGSALNDAYLVVTTGDDYFTVQIDENGNFSHVFSKCDDNQISIVAFDRENLYVSDEIIITEFGDQILDLGMVEVCEESIEEFIRFTIEGTDEVLILDPDAWIFPGDKTVLGGIQDGTNFSANIQFDGIVAGNYQPTSFNFISQGQVACLDNCNDSSVDLNDVVVVGEYITGAFEVFGEGPGGNLIPVTGSFRILVDGEASFGSISGKVFLDEGLDGSSAGDINLEEVPVRLISSTGEFFPPVIFPDGNYAFEDLSPGTYEVWVTLDSLMLNVSPKDQTGDDMDSDFGEDLISDPYVITNAGEMYSNVDAGVYSDMNCFAFGEGCDNWDCYVFVQTTGGFGPYEYLWDFGATTETANCPGTSDEYAVTVTDRYGQTCNTSTFVENFPAYFEGRAWQDLNGDNIYQDDEPGLAGLEVNLYEGWSPDQPAFTVTTSNNGQYSFEYWGGGNMFITFEAPDGMVPVEKGAFNNFLDSHIQSDTFSLEPITHATDEFEVYNCGWYGVNAGFREQ